MYRLWLAVMLTLAAAHTALAIDCTRAKTDVERAICGDGEAQSADQALAAAFDHVRGLLSDHERAGLRASQLAWIRNRDTGCQATRAGTPLPSCLAAASRTRQRFLEGRPEAGDTEKSLFTPVFMFRPATRDAVPLHVEAIRFTGAGAWQKKANAAIDKLVQEAVGLTDVRDSPPPPAQGSLYFVDLTVSLSLASPRLVSVRVAHSSFFGQAHPLEYETNINIAVADGRDVRFDDYVNAAGARDLFAYCRSQVAKAKSQGDDGPASGGDEAGSDLLEEVAERTRDLSNWRFGAAGIDIDYGADAFGGYGRCACSCEIPYSRLRAFAGRDVGVP